MKIITLSFSKAEIFQQVALATAYTGAKAEPPNNNTNTSDKLISAGQLFDRVATINSDSSILSTIYTQVCGEVQDKFKTFITAVDTSLEALTLTLELSGAYDDSLTESVKGDIFEAMVAGITAGWFRYSLPSAVTDLENRCSQLLSRAFAKLCHRRKPDRRQKV